MEATTKQIDPEILAQREEQDRKRYQVAYDYIKSNALKGVSFTEAAKLVHVSPFHFHRNFHRLFKITPKKLATQVQVEAVKEMLLKGTPIAQIVKDCGFAHQSHMGTRFKKFVGQAPMKWLKAEKAKQASN